MPGSGDGYHVAVQDGGPNYGLSVKVKSLSGDSGNFIIDLTVTNSYIRHTSVFVSFLEADGVTPMQSDDQRLARDARVRPLRAARRASV